MLSSTPAHETWTLDEREFSSSPTSADKLRFLLRYAILAPSGHNTQPWRFLVDDDEVMLFADRTRSLPVVDPEYRELTISCGAALLHLRLAFRYFGYRDLTEYLPWPIHADLLARVRFGGPYTASEEEQRMFRAIPERRTNRLAYEDRAVPEAFLRALMNQAAREGAWLHIASDTETCNAIADLVAEGDRIQWADRAFREELARWSHSHEGSRADGIPGHNIGFGGFTSRFGPLVMRTFDLGDGTAARDRDLVNGSPVIAVLGTRRDSRKDWLFAGQALARVLLRAQSFGLSASFLNQPIEVPRLRPKLLGAIRGDGYPQIVLRLGYGPPIGPTPRRRVEDVQVR